MYTPGRRAGRGGDSFISHPQSPAEPGTQQALKVRVQRETERSNHERAKGFFLSALEGHGNKRRSGRRSGAALGRTWENSGLGLGSDTSDMVCGGPRSRRPHTSLGRTYGGGLHGPAEEAQEGQTEKANTEVSKQAAARQTARVSLQTLA